MRAALVAGVPGAIGPLALAAPAAGSAAYIGGFFLRSPSVPSPGGAVVWSLGFVVLGERLLGTALAGLAQLSPTWESRAIFVGLLDDVPDRLVREGIPAGGAAVVRLLIVTAVALATRRVAPGPPPAGRGVRLITRVRLAAKLLASPPELRRRSAAALAHLRLSRNGQCRRGRDHRR